MTNRVVKLVKRPVGLAKRDDFLIEDQPTPEPGPGQFRVRNTFISLDPAMRGWMAEGRSYVPPVKLGEVMRAYAAGLVEASDNPDFPVGTAVTGLLGVQTHAIADGRGVMKADTAIAPLQRWIGGLGMPGWTAYFGLLDIGQPKPGETVVVSAASGAVGGIVGQIAKLKGCRAVGIAGGPDKCRDVVERLGFDACVDYKSPSLFKDLKAAAPQGVDVYFENVGGKVLDAVLPQMNRFGRMPVCGLISGYNATEPVPGPVAFPLILIQRLKVQGFIVFDFIERYGEAIEALAGWHHEGRLKLSEDVRQGGVDAFPDVLNLLYSGGNHGKLVLEV